MSGIPLKILAIDDEQLLLWALKRAGRERSLDITTAATTEQALSEMAACHYDLFLLDFKPQEKSRIELLKHIDEQSPYVPLIIMTTSDTRSCELNDAIRCVRKQGAWHLLEKPFSLDRLVNFIEVIFQTHRNMKLCMTDLTHNFDNEKRLHTRRPHVLPFSFTLRTITNGVEDRIASTGILTDISACGIGMLSHLPLKQDQVLCFGPELKEQCGIVAWSWMIEDQTCRVGIQLC